MEIKPIRSAADHARALEEIQRLWERAMPGTAEGDQFDVLATLIDAYEREHHPVPPPDPIEAIRFRMEQMGLEQRDLAAIFASRARSSEILGRKRKLSLAMIRRLHEELSIPLEVLVKDYALRRARRVPTRTKKSSSAPKRRSA
jgi:HTH-type transcriptional regulator / antitoxin HigA